MLQVINVQPIDFGIMNECSSTKTLPLQKRQSIILDTACPKVIQTVDVLCGRDKLSHSHTGNKRFRNIVLMFREEYQTASSRDIKTNITCQIVSMIRACGGRFLKQDEKSGEWKDVGDHYAREKVSHALRSAKDPNRPKVKKQREVKKYVPTAEEDALFQSTLEDQQLIFRRLIAQDSEDAAPSICDSEFLALSL